MSSLFTHEEGTALVAVERANGGELAPLEQVLWTLYGFTPPASRPSPAGFAASVRHLLEVGLVEYVDSQLGLTPQGRKLLRRSGMPNSPRHVEQVTQLLQESEELDFEPDLTSAAPSEADVRQALSDGKQIEETGGVGTPMIGGEVPMTASILGVGGGLAFGSHWVPAVIHDDPSDPSDPGDPGDPGDRRDPSASPEPASAATPGHPLLDRLFGHRRGDRAHHDGTGGDD
jgi:hypothetical protein